MFNFSTRKVGGLRIVKLGRLTLSFSVAKRGTRFKPIKGSMPRANTSRRPSGADAYHPAAHAVPCYVVGEA